MCEEMCEEDVETAKSEFRLGMMCILHMQFIYSKNEEGEV